MNDLQKIDEVIPGVILDLRYATTNNVTGKKLYDKPVAALRRATMIALKEAANLLNNQGYRLVVWDAYRPPGVQEDLLKVCDDERYVKKISNHCRGITVDVTLADADGRLIDMGTDHDEFDERAHADSTLITEEQTKNRIILKSTMERFGFRQLKTEWWHFDFIPTLNEEVLDMELREL